MKIAVASDHVGWKDKTRLIERLEALGHDVTDFGTDSEESTDYPDYAAKAARAVTQGKCDQAVLRGIRAAACQTVDAARFSRAHNNANVLCLGARLSSPATMREIVDTWLATNFDGGRHARRVDKISALEENKEV